MTPGGSPGRHVPSGFGIGQPPTQLKSDSEAEGQDRREAADADHTCGMRAFGRKRPATKRRRKSHGAPNVISPVSAGLRCLARRCRTGGVKRPTGVGRARLSHASGPPRSQEIARRLEFACGRQMGAVWPAPLVTEPAAPHGASGPWYLSRHRWRVSRRSVCSASSGCPVVTRAQSRRWALRTRCRAATAGYRCRSAVPTPCPRSRRSIASPPGARRRPNVTRPPDVLLRRPGSEDAMAAGDDATAPRTQGSDQKKPAVAGFSHPGPSLRRGTGRRTARPAVSSYARLPS